MTVGEFFGELGQGITNIIGGVGDNIGAQADLNQATAAQILANAEATNMLIAAKNRQEAVRQRNLLIIVAIVFASGLLGIFLVTRK